MSVQVKKLRKCYGEQVAVNAINFTIRKGEVVGFLGPNGAGKSTTLKMICGYLPPSEGEAWLGGLNVQENRIEAQRKLGYLPESNPLYFDMYVREYLEFLSGVHRLHQPQVRIQNIIDQTGLGPEQHKKIGTLSKGYKQRVGLAQALLHDPEVLILDEPTSGLDPNQIIEIRELIKHFGANKTVILSTHIMQEVEAMCNRVIMISKGNLVADDTLSGLQEQHAGMSLEQIFRLRTTQVLEEQAT